VKAKEDKWYIEKMRENERQITLYELGRLEAEKDFMYIICGLAGFLIGVIATAAVLI